MERQATPPQSQLSAAALCLACSRQPGLNAHQILVNTRDIEAQHGATWRPNSPTSPESEARRPSLSYQQVPTKDGAPESPSSRMSSRRQILGIGVPGTSAVPRSPSQREGDVLSPLQRTSLASSLAIVGGLFLISALGWIGASIWLSPADGAPARKAKENWAMPLSLNLPGLERAAASGNISREVMHTIAERLGQLERLGQREETPPKANLTAVSAQQHPGNSFFCFALMLPWSNEQLLLQMQYRQNISIFACDEAAIYSNVEIEVAPGKLKTNIANTDLTAAMGGEFGTALNTGIFLVVWKQVITDKRYLAHDWIVKVDPDAVFLPERLRTITQGIIDGVSGTYFNNCKYGMHGPLEVFSRNAVRNMATGLDTCQAHFFQLCSGECKWGEDMFLDQCLDKVLACERKDNFHMLLEDHCDPPIGWQSCEDPTAASFHPFKALEDYYRCYQSAMGLAKPAAPAPKAQLGAALLGAAPPGAQPQVLPWAVGQPLGQPETQPQAAGVQQATAPAERQAATPVEEQAKTQIEELPAFGEGQQAADVAQVAQA